MNDEKIKEIEYVIKVHKTKVDGLYGDIVKINKIIKEQELELFRLKGGGNFD